MQRIYCRIEVVVTQKIKQDVSLGKNIRKLRNDSKMTQEEVVTWLQLSGIDISRSIYSQIECGTYNIRVSELIALSKLFKTDINSFFVGL
ncbi:MAG: helix-turn-helix domain-containing protein [Lachnospiraceae bacterium]|nr:helix-turn-helix domain-containing protein [Lachnospiraceae bacterium]